MNLSKIPDNASGSIIFSGCCWGALPVFQRASKYKKDIPIKAKTPEQSIAIRYLRAGAQAFIGCTGSHYSPLKDPFNYYGKPMHDYFWKYINKGYQPAEALFQAKREYLKNMPFDKKDAFSRAIESKIYYQFTCLGLGW